MVGLVEGLVVASARRGDFGLARALNKVVEENRGKSPEAFEGVTLYDRASGISYFHTDYIHDFNSRVIIYRSTKQPENVTEGENIFLAILEEKPNELTTRKEFENRGYSIISLRKNICTLRQKLEIDRRHPKIIILKRGKGYFLRDNSKLLANSFGSNNFGR